MLEVFVVKRRDHKAAPDFLKHSIKWYEQPEIVVT